jgi:hypothetical protein
MIFHALRLLTRLYPFQFPRTSLVASLPSVPENFGTFRAKNGLRIAAYPNGCDYVVKNLFWFGNFEPWITTVLQYLVRPGETICDTGANIGVLNQFH